MRVSYIVAAAAGLMLTAHRASAKRKPQRRSRALRIDVTTSSSRIRVGGVNILELKSHKRVQRGFQLARIRRVLGKPTRTRTRSQTKSFGGGLYGANQPPPPSSYDSHTTTHVYAKHGLVFRSERTSGAGKVNPTWSGQLDQVVLKIHTGAASKRHRSAAIKKTFTGSLWINGRRVEPTKPLSAPAARPHFRLYGMSCSGVRKGRKLVSISCSDHRMTLEIAIGRGGIPTSYSLKRDFDEEMLDLGTVP